MKIVVKTLARVSVVFVLQTPTLEALPITWNDTITILYSASTLLHKYSRNCLYWVHLKMFLWKCGGPSEGSAGAIGVVSSGSLEATAGVVEDG